MMGWLEKVVMIEDYTEAVPCIRQFAVRRGHFYANQLWPCLINIGVTFGSGTGNLQSVNALIIQALKTMAGSTRVTF